MRSQFSASVVIFPRLKAFLFPFAVAAVSVSAWADGPVFPAPQWPEIEFSLEKAVLAGPGCELNSHVNDLGEGKLLLNLPNLAISLSEWEPEMSDRKSCTLAVPYKLPEGYQVRGVRIETDIYLFKSTKASAAFAIAAAAGGRPDRTQLTFSPGKSELVRKKSWNRSLDLSDDTDSRCLNTGVLSLITVISGLKQEIDDYSKLGLADNGEILAQVQLERCSGTDQRARTPYNVRR